MGLIIGGFITSPEITPLEDGLKDEEAKTALPHLKDAQKKKKELQKLPQHRPLLDRKGCEGLKHLVITAEENDHSKQYNR